MAITSHEVNSLFGERLVSIPDNKYLEVVCNHILRLVDNDKSLLDGDTPNEIDHKLTWAVWSDNGLHAAFDSGLDGLKTFFFDIDRAVPQDTISRARRFLLQEDYIRISQKAQKSAFQQEKRLGATFKR